ncbi:AraC family transcriptional regulator [Deltaproteobacteria bacterium Smac51]|nr:AraC family transcriptional regulator [Deltaproteobacteria bacterium Smac51]
MREQIRTDIGTAKNMLRERLLDRMPRPGDYSTGIDGVNLYRRDEKGQSKNCFYKPAIIKLVQGCKRSMVGSDEFFYGENDLLVAGVDMPNTSFLMDASPDKPFLSLTIDLDKDIIAQLALTTPLTGNESPSSSRGLLIQDVDAEMLDALLRLEELIDRPEMRPVMAPMIIREIHFRLLLGPNGHLLRSFHTYGSQSHQVARAITWLKQNFHKPVLVEELAEKVNMAPSTFHRHFKEVTTLSPVQYQKRLRLHAAQHLMLAENYDSVRASEAVGYESLTQFNREYKRLFGDPPRRDIIKQRHSCFPAAPDSKTASSV